MTLLSERLEIIKRMKYSDMNKIYDEIIKIKNEIKENIDEELFNKLQDELYVILYELKFPHYYEDGTYIYINFKQFLDKIINEIKLKNK